MCSQQHNTMNYPFTLTFESDGVICRYIVSTETPVEKYYIFDIFNALIENEKKQIFVGAGTYKIEKNTIQQTNVVYNQELYKSYPFVLTILNSKWLCRHLVSTEYPIMVVHEKDGSVHIFDAVIGGVKQHVKVMAEQYIIERIKLFWE